MPELNGGGSGTTPETVVEMKKGITDFL